jgi:MYND finger
MDSLSVFQEVAFIEAVYRQCPDINCVKCYKCWKKEDPMQEDRLFPVCSICKSTYYCSKRCQQADWKKHKVYCQPAVEHQDPQMKQIERRVDRFRAKTVPLLEVIVCLKLYHYQLENCNEAHVLDRFGVRIFPFEIQAIYMIPKPITARQSKYYWELFCQK